MRLDVPLKALLVVVRRELLTAHGAHLPVTFHVLLKLALIIVRGKHHITKGAFLVHIKASRRGGEKGKKKKGKLFNLLLPNKIQR